MLKVKVFDSEAFCGYKQITTFYQDFGIAEVFGINAIRDTYKQCFNSWKYDYKYLTELVLVLNWKVAEHYEENHAELTKLYDELWRKAERYAITNLKGKELDYYYHVTDMPD